MKYIIEIKPEYEDNFKGLMLLGAKDSNLFVDTLAVEELEELNSDYINEHFSDLQDTVYKKGLEDGKAIHEKGCEGCEYEHRGDMGTPCEYCSKNYKNLWKAKDDNYDIIRNGIQNWVTELNVKLTDITKILEDMRCGQ